MMNTTNFNLRREAFKNSIIGKAVAYLEFTFFIVFLTIISFSLMRTFIEFEYLKGIWIATLTMSGISLIAYILSSFAGTKSAPPCISWKYLPLMKSGKKKVKATIKEQINDLAHKIDAEPYSILTKIKKLSEDIEVLKIEFKQLQEEKHPLQVTKSSLEYLLKDTF